MAQHNYHGYQYQTFEEDGQHFWMVEVDGDMPAGNYDQPGSPYRDGKDTEGSAHQQAKAYIQSLERKGF